MLVIPLSFPIAYAKLLGKGRGVSILAAMLVGFGSLLAFGFLTHVGSSLIETRFGNFGSILFNMISISSNTGAINASLGGMSPHAIISFLVADVCSSHTRRCWNWHDLHVSICDIDSLYRRSDGW